MSSSIQACIVPREVWQSCLMPFFALSLFLSFSFSLSLSLSLPLSLSLWLSLFSCSLFSLPHNKHFSVMWSVECIILSLQLEENRFDKIPFSPRRASKAGKGEWQRKEKHGAARQASAQTQGPGPRLRKKTLTLYLRDPAALVSETLTSVRQRGKRGRGLRTSGTARKG